MGGDGTASKAAWRGEKGTLFTAFHNTRTRDVLHNHKGRLKITGKSDSSKLGIVSPWDSQPQPAQKWNEQKKSAEMHLQCRAVARNTCRWMLGSWLLLPGDQLGTHLWKPPHCPVQALPGTADGSAATQPAGTVTQQESLLLSACFSGRWRCTTLLLPRAAWGMSTWGQPDAGTLHPARTRCQGACSSLLPATLVPASPRQGGTTASRGGGCSCGGSRGNSWLL